MFLKIFIIPGKLITKSELDNLKIDKKSKRSISPNYFQEFQKFVGHCNSVGLRKSFVDMFSSLMLLTSGKSNLFDNMTFCCVMQNSFLTREEIMDMGAGKMDESDKLEITPEWLKERKLAKTKTERRKQRRS